MPIQKFSHEDKEQVIPIATKSTIRIVSCLFSKGFERSADLGLEVSFFKAGVSYNLPFNIAGTLRQNNGLYFYHGNGAVFGIPAGSNRLTIKVQELKSVDFEFVLTYDFYPGSI